MAKTPAGLSEYMSDTRTRKPRNVTCMTSAGQSRVRAPQPSDTSSVHPRWVCPFNRKHINLPRGYVFCVDLWGYQRASLVLAIMAGRGLLGMATFNTRDCLLELNGRRRRWVTIHVSVRFYIYTQDHS